MPTITPFLWYDNQAEEAMDLYTSIFKNTKVLSVNKAQGRTISVSFVLEGQQFTALNGGPHHKFTPAISLFVSCETQQEVDQLWQRFSDAGGTPVACGWITDKFGVSWQIVPERLLALMNGPDPIACGRVANALMAMQKIDIAALERAHANA